MSETERLAEATSILRAILDADERGQGQPFGAAMDRAHRFVNLSQICHSPAFSSTTAQIKTEISSTSSVG